ncbi:DeoR family transcriptional regulator [archaeon]|nr:DeoR family transcriptional regulator [archaeon]NCP79238.1 DeoR family transcriptional regulator [archaeon]NCP97815.1 DeoR family transcriptional regulator [archaeon]NCQ07005.1 DeoR family transcriptional regulator [archaeon]NCQ50801.1 DeoR family transcriptional regulator [archaeon]
MTKTSKKILEELSSRESISISQLNQSLNISDRTLRHNLSRLLKNNLISIAMDTDDLRKKMVRLRG